MLMCAPAVAQATVSTEAVAQGALVLMLIHCRGGIHGGRRCAVGWVVAIAVVHIVVRRRGPNATSPNRIVLFSTNIDERAG